MGLYIIIIYVCIYRERSITYQSILYQNLKTNMQIIQYFSISLYPQTLYVSGV